MKPEKHWAPQEPAVQLGKPNTGVSHFASQPPQSEAVVVRSTQREPHCVSGGEQVAKQPLALHNAAGLPHADCAPQPPQDSGRDRSTSQPLATSPSQSDQPGSQLPIAHAPCALHIGLACGGLQGAHKVSLQPRCGSVFETHKPSQTFSSLVQALQSGPTGSRSPPASSASAPSVAASAGSLVVASRVAPASIEPASRAAAASTALASMPPEASGTESDPESQAAKMHTPKQAISQRIFEVCAAVGCGATGEPERSARSSFQLLLILSYAPRLSGMEAPSFSLQGRVRTKQSGELAERGKGTLMTTQLQRDAASEDAARESAAGHIRATDETAAGLKGIFKQLTQEHAEILRLLFTAETNADLTQAEAALRRAGELIEAHDQAETTVLYAPLRERSKSAAIADAHEEDASKVLRVLTQVRSLPSRHHDWRRTVHQLVAMLQQHMRGEEVDDFPAAQQTLGAAGDALLDAYVKEHAALLEHSPH